MCRPDTCKFSLGSNGPAVSCALPPKSSPVPGWPSTQVCLQSGAGPEGAALCGLTTHPARGCAFSCATSLAFSRMGSNAASVG